MEVLQQVDANRLRSLRDRREYFWLDLTDPSSDELDAVSQHVTVHDLAREDTHEFGQRAKLDDYPDSALLVFYGAQRKENGLARLVEVHLHLCPEALITVTRESVTALDRARHHVAANSAADEGQVVHRVLDALTDSLLAAFEGFDAAIDDLQGAVARHPTTANRQRIFSLRRQLAGMRQVVMPQRDLLAPEGALVDAVPNLGQEATRKAIRDVHDHLDQASRLVESYREQLASLLDLYLTEVSTRLNEFMKRLSVVATVFLPLTFLAGFFGMNFGYLAKIINSPWSFYVFGIALPAAAGLAVASYLRRTANR